MSKYKSYKNSKFQNPRTKYKIKNQKCKTQSSPLLEFSPTTIEGVIMAAGENSAISGSCGLRAEFPGLAQEEFQKNPGKKSKILNAISTNIKKKHTGFTSSICIL
jgi:hypothetical protein